MRKLREYKYISLLVIIDQIIKLYIYLNYMGMEQE